MSVSKSVYDNVHKPEHYTAGRKFEPKDVIRDWGLNFNLGNAVKYLARAGRKDDIIQDLRKAQEFIQFEIDAIEAERNNMPEELPVEEFAKQMNDDLLDIVLYGLHALGIDPMRITDPKERSEQSKKEVKKVQEMLHSKEPKCTFNPVFADLENGKGACVGVLEVTVPAGADPEDIIKAVIEKVYNGGM